MATHPENTIAAFRHAISCGSDGVELDVTVTLDDRLVVTHDMVLAGGRIVRNLRAADLPLPTLDEVLALAAHNFCFDVEAKTALDLAPHAADYAMLLHQAIRRSPALDRTIVRSFDHSILRAFHELDADRPLAALIDFDTGEWVSTARAAAASIISPRYSTITAERVTRAHEAGLEVSAWTVNYETDWDRMSDLGVDTIITDDPARAVRYFRYRFRSG